MNSEYVCDANLGISEKKTSKRMAADFYFQVHIRSLEDESLGKKDLGMLVARECVF